MIKTIYFLRINKNKSIETNKNPAPYITNLSAVKKTHIPNNGIDNTKQNNPAHTKTFGLRQTNIVINIIIKSISCGFIN